MTAEPRRNPVAEPARASSVNGPGMNGPEPGTPGPPKPPIRATLDIVAGVVGGVVIGDGSVEITGVAGIREAGPGDLTFLDPSGLSRPSGSDAAPQTGDRRTLHEARDQFERDLILRTLAEQQGNMSKTAEVLGVERSNLYRKMRAFGIAPTRRPEPEEEAD